MLAAESACRHQLGAYTLADTCLHCMLLQGCHKSACGRPTTRSFCWRPSLLQMEEDPSTRLPCLSL
jgi:hypothetical protein